MISRSEFVIRNKSQKVQLFKASAGPGSNPPSPANHLYRIRNLGPGDIKVTGIGGPAANPGSGYLYAGCSIDIPGTLNVTPGGIVLSTEGSTPAPTEGGNGIEQAAGWYEILDMPCCCGCCDKPSEGGS